MKQNAEGLVLAGREFGKLRYNNIINGSLKIYRQDLNLNRLARFKEGVDYDADYENGLIRRTAGSKIPDFSGHVYFDVNKFIQSNDTDWSNKEFLLYCDYSFDERKNEVNGVIAKERTRLLKTNTLKEWAREHSGETVDYLLLGDSISSGGEVAPTASYFARLAAHLKKGYGITVNVHNHTVPGYAVNTGYDKLLEVIDKQKYGLASIAFGMNDQNIYGNRLCIPPDRFAALLKECLSLLQSRNIPAFTVTSCYPNKMWHFNSGQIAVYNNATITVAKKLGVPVADAGYMWERELMSGKTDSSLLYNNINHPNDYGQGVYFEIVRTLF